MDRASTGLSHVVTTTLTERMNLLFGIDPILVNLFTRGGTYTPNAAYSGKIQVPLTEETDNLLRIAEVMLIGKQDETNRVIAYFVNATRSFGRFFALPADEVPYSLKTAEGDPLFNFFTYDGHTGTPTRYVELSEVFCPQIREAREEIIARQERGEPSELYQRVFPAAAEKLMASRSSHQK